MMKKRKSTGIIKLEERVLFEAAAAPEIAALAAMNEAAADADNDAEADVQDSSGEKGDVPAGERAIDAIDKSALEAALAAGPDGANIADEGVVRENGEKADGLEAEDDASDDVVLDPVAGAAFDAPEASAADGLLAEAGNNGEVVLDLSDPSALVIDSNVDIEFTIDGTAPAAAAENIADAINENTETDRHELLIINSNTYGTDIIIEEAGEGKDILVLDSTSADPMADIAAFMAEKDYDYDAVHFVTHGDETGILVGTRHITEGEYFAPMKDHLAEDADIMIYGCDTAAAENGQAFLQEMADATGADIAASVDSTGSSAYGANWNLEYTIGSVETDSITVSDEWNNELADITIGTGGKYKDLNDYWTQTKQTPGYLYERDVITLMSDVTESYTGPIYLLDDGLSGGEVVFVSNTGKAFTYTFENTMYVGSPGNSDTIVLQLGSVAGDQDIALEGIVAVSDNDTIIMNNSGIDGTLGLGNGAKLTNTLTDKTLKSAVWNLNIATEGTATITGGTLLTVDYTLSDAGMAGTLFVTEDSQVTVGSTVNYGSGTIKLDSNTVFSGSGTVNNLILGTHNGQQDTVTLKNGTLEVKNDVMLEDTDILTLNNAGIDGKLLFHGSLEVSGTSSVNDLNVTQNATTLITGGTLNVGSLTDDGGSVKLNIGTGAIVNVANVFDYSNDTISLAGGTLSAEGQIDTLLINGEGSLQGRIVSVAKAVNVAANNDLVLSDGVTLHATVNLEGELSGSGGTLDTLNITGDKAVIDNHALTVANLGDNGGTVILTVNNGGVLTVVNPFAYTDDTIILNNGTLNGNGTLKTLTLNGLGGTLEGGNLTVTDAINIAAKSILNIRQTANLTAQNGISNAGKIAGIGDSAVLNLTGDLENTGTVETSVALRITAGALENEGSVGVIFDVGGNVENKGTIKEIRSVSGNLTNTTFGTIDELGNVSGKLVNDGVIGDLYNVKDIASVTNNGVINMLLLTVSGETNASGLVFTTVNEALGSLANHGLGGLVLDTGVAIALNPYTYAESNTFRQQNNVVTAAEALTLSADKLIALYGQTTIVLDTPITFTSKPSALSTVEGYSLNSEATLANIIVGSSVTLNLNDGGTSMDYQFKNVGIEIADGGTVNINKDAEVSFSGNGVTANYKFLSYNAYTMNNGVTYKGTGITNAGTLNIDNAQVTFTRESLGKFSSIERYNTYGIKNDGANAVVNITGSDIVFSLGTAASPVSRAADAYALWNVEGAMYIKDSDISMTSVRSSVDENDKSIAVYNESRNAANAVSGSIMQQLSESDQLSSANLVVDDGRITLNGGDEEVYSVVNNGSAYFENSFVLAAGRDAVYGIKNDVNGLLEYHVTGDAYTDQESLDAFFASRGINWADYQNNPEKLISDYIIPGISGKNINTNSTNVNNTNAVGNYGQAYLHYTGSISAGNDAWVGSTTQYTYTDVPVLLLYGSFNTVGTAEEGQNIVLSDLDQVTIVGKGTEAKSYLYSYGTATNLLNDVSVKDLVNDGSQIHVTGSYEQSIFSVYDATSNLLNWTGNDNSTIVNLYGKSNQGSGLDGEIFFGRAATDARANIFHSMDGIDTLVDREYDNRVHFSADVSYDFTNHARITIENYIGLGVNEEHAVSIENIDNTHYTYKIGEQISAYFTIEKAISTEMEIDGQIVTLQDVNGNPIKLTDDYGNVTMFVEYGALTEVVDSNVKNAGVVNRSGNMTMNGINILNTNAQSVAVTNIGGIFSMDGGALIGTYSGLDNLEMAYKEASSSSIDITIRQGRVTLNDITAVAGTAFGIRNTGTVEFSNENTALITNDLDITVVAGSSLDKLFRPFDDSAIPEVDKAIAIANYTVAAAAQVIHIATSPTATATYTIKISSYDEYSTKGSISPAAIPASWTVDLVEGDVQIGEQTFEPSTHTITGSSPLITHAVYGSAYTNATVTVDNAEIRLSHVELYSTTALYNEAKATVTNVSSFENYLYSVQNVGIKDAANPKSGNWPGWCISCEPADTATFVNTVNGENVARVSDAHLSFSCVINASGVENKDTLTLEGLNITDDQGNILSSGGMTISGSPYRVTGTETFLNLTVTSPENETYAIINNGTLIIENTYTLKQDILDAKGNVIFAAGNYSVDEADAVMAAAIEYQKDNPNKDLTLYPTNYAYISSFKGTAIQNKGNLTMINATVKDSVNGIENAGKMYMVNSQIVDNSSWGFINVSGDAHILDSTIAFNHNGMDIQAGTVTLVNSILVNDGLLSDVNRSTHTLTAEEMGINYQESGGTLIGVDKDDNIIGENRQDKENAADWLNHAKANSDMLGSLYTFLGTTYFADSTNSFALSANSPALSGGVLVAITRDSNGSISGYTSGTATGSLTGSLVPADKDGHSRIPDEDNNIVVGATVPGSPMKPSPEPEPGPGPGPEPDPTIEQGSNVVTTNQDVIDNTDGLISLREAITYAMTYGDGNVYFSAKDLGHGDVTITLDSALGGIGIDGGSVTINGVDHIYNNSNTNITIDGSRISGSTVVIGETGNAEFKDISVTAGTGTYADSFGGNIGGVFLVLGGSLAINGTGTYTGNTVSPVDLGGIIASISGTVNVTGNITFRNGIASTGGGFLLQYGEDAVSVIGDTNSNIIIEGMEAVRGAVLDQFEGKTTFINTVVKDSGIYDETEKKVLTEDLFNITDEFTLVNASVYNNFAEALFGLLAVSDMGEESEIWDGKVFVVNSSIVNNAVGYQMTEEGKYVYDNNGNRLLDYSTNLFSVEKVSETETSTSAGNIYILNTLISTEVDTTDESVVVQVVNSATGEYGKYSFLYNADGSLVLDADTYVPVTNPGNGAAESGVITAVYTDLDGNRAIALKHTVNGQWMDMDGNVLSQYYQENIKYDAIGEISVSGNGSHRYIGQSNLYIGAYSRAYAETAVQNNIVVTTTADEMNGNADISLREAVKYAEKLHEQTGFTYTIVFADGLANQGDIILDHTLYINGSLNIAGSNNVLSASGVLDEAMIVVNTSGVNINNLTLDGMNNYNDLTGGRGIFEVTERGLATVNDVNMLNGQSALGGAIYNTGTLTVNGGLFSNNTAVMEGGAIYNEGTLSVNGSTFSNNDAEYGGVIFNTGSLVVSGSTFSNNTVEGDSIIYSTEDISISGSTFSGNMTTGSVIYADGTISVSGSTFTNNTANSLVESGESVNISSGTFTGNSAVQGSLISARKDIRITDAAFDTNYSGEAIVYAAGNLNTANSSFTNNAATAAIVTADGSVTVSGSTFAKNATVNDNASIILAGGDLNISGSTVSGNAVGENGGILDAAGSLNMSGSSIVDNISGLTAVYAEKDVTISNSTISGNTPEAAVIVGENVSISGSTVSGNTATLSVVLADAVCIANSTVSGNSARQIIRSTGNLTLNEVSMANNKGNALLSAEGYITVISSTLADTEGDGVVKVVSDKDVYILNSTVASASETSGSLITGANIYIVNSITVTDDAAAPVAAGTVYAAYSVVSGNALYQYSDQVQSGWSYTSAFGNTKVNGEGMLVPVSSIASQRGVFVRYSVNADGSLNIAYSDQYDDELITDGNYYDPVVNQSWKTITVASPVNGTVVRYVHEQYIVMPGIGAYWNGSYTVDYGPGLNDAFINSAYDGTLDYYSWSEYDAVVASLPSGIAEDVPVSVSGIDGFSGNIYEGMNSGFRLTERFDLGGMVSGETYISETVGADGEDQGGEFFVTPTTAEGVPVMLDAESIDEVGDIALEDTLAELAGGMENIAEKASSLFRRAEIFKDNFDKAIEELLDIKA